MAFTWSVPDLQELFWETAKKVFDFLVWCVKFINDLPFWVKLLFAALTIILGIIIMKYLIKNKNEFKHIYTS